uniref:PPIase cyclophilin-type domain-containing protein n=1 Tax=Elaeophora elaphi TaxID=1147741 RepID=A0A158Q7L6_9BILA
MDLSLLKGQSQALKLLKERLGIDEDTDEESIRFKRDTVHRMSVTLQTTLGDIKIELYCDLCPKTCENFLALCASSYYDNCIFHRNIKDFMVQTGDPTGTGKGGDSIWGGPIEDELNTALKHDARGVVSMAGNGPNTSRSQFFITYAKHPTLDLKYTIFGRNKTVLRHLTDTKDEKMLKSDEKYPNEKYPIGEEKQMNLERIREMQKYFEQYTEEYVQLESESEIPCEIITKSDRLRQRLEPLLNFEQDSSLSPLSVREIVDILRAERAEDIICMKVSVSDTHDRYVIICTPHNMRHGEAIVLAIRKCFKLKTDNQVQPPKKAKVGQWLCYIFEDISIHIMTREARLRYDLESLWGIGWMETLEDEVNILNPECPMPAAN